MFELKFNDLEKQRLLFYASHTMRDSLHWGDGEVIIPEEQILEQKIQKTEYKLTLEFEQIRLLTNWFLDATGEGLLLAGEDISILTKIIGLLTPYHNELKREYDVKLRMLKAQIDDAEKVLNKLTKIVPKTEEKADIEGTQNELVKEPVLDENIEKIIPKINEKVVAEEETEESALKEKLERISKKRREVEEYNKELIDKFQEERVDSQHEEIADQRIELEEEQKKVNFEEKTKRAKELREEMKKVENVAKKAKKKARGKKLF
jgi:hypothetical protein